MRKLDIFLLIILFVFICFCEKKVIAQNLQAIYASSVLFAGPNQGSVTLVSGVSHQAGATTVTIPDETGTMLTDSSNYNDLLKALKALDATYGSHSGINWTSFGH